MAAASNEFEGQRNPYSANVGGNANVARTSGKATASLVLGIFTIFCSLFTGIPAIIFGALGLGDIKHSNGRLQGRGLAIAGIVLGSLGSALSGLGIMVALLLPAVQAAREAARMNASINNMKQIGLGLHNYHGVKGQLPNNVVDDQERPLLSWRLGILPYIEEQALYTQFNLKEAWDGPQNKPLADPTPSVFVSPSQPMPVPGETNVVAIVGPDTAFPPDGALNFKDIADGLSRTILAVQLANTGTAWSEPRDITVDEFIAALHSDPGGPGLRRLHARGVVCLFGDGAVRVIPSDTPDEVLRALCTRAGGENVEIPTD